MLYINKIEIDVDNANLLFLDVVYLVFQLKYSLNSA